MRVSSVFRSNNAKNLHAWLLENSSIKVTAIISISRITVLRPYLENFVCEGNTLPSEEKTIAKCWIAVDVSAITSINPSTKSQSTGIALVLKICKNETYQAEMGKSSHF